MKREHISPWFTIVVLLFSLIFVLWPLIKPGFFITDDGEWMIIRLSAFYQSLAEGQFPVRFLGRLNQSYGYPVANFLYPGFLYIGSLIHIVGFSFLDSVKVIIGVSIVGSVGAIYFILRKTFNETSSVFGALSFLFSPYLLYDLYHRGSVGEIFALFCGSIALLSITRGWVWMLAPSVGLLLISHNTVALILSLGLGLLIVTNRKRIPLLLSFVLGIGMSAFFWVPALFERHVVFFDSITVSDPSQYFIGMDKAAFLGIPIIIALSLLLGLKKHLSVWDKSVTIIVMIGIVLSLPLSQFFWNVPFFSRLVQFPYRFLVLPVLFGPWIIAMVIDHVKVWQRKFLYAVFIVIWIFTTLITMKEIQYVSRPSGYYTTNEGTTTVANEYMPRWVQHTPLTRSVDTLEVLTGDAEIERRSFAGEKIETEVDVKEVSIVQINKIYYPGWGVTIDNVLVPLDYHNPLGVMRVEVPKGSHTLSAQFRETPLRFVADIVSVLSGLVYLIFIRRIVKMT